MLLKKIREDYLDTFTEKNDHGKVIIEAFTHFLRVLLAFKIALIFNAKHFFLRSL